MRSIFFVSILLSASFNVSCARSLAQRLAMKSSVEDDNTGLAGSISTKTSPANFVYGSRRTEQDIYVDLKFVGGKDGESMDVLSPISTPRETPSAGLFSAIKHKQRRAAIEKKAERTTHKKAIRCHGEPCPDKEMCRFRGTCGKGPSFCNRNSSWKKDCESANRLVTDKKTGHGCSGKACPNPNDCRNKFGDCGSGPTHCNRNSTWKKEGCSKQTAVSRRLDEATAAMSAPAPLGGLQAPTSEWAEADGSQEMKPALRRVEVSAEGGYKAPLRKEDGGFDAPLRKENTESAPVRRAEVKAPSSGASLRARLAKQDVKGDSEHRESDKRRRFEQNQFKNDLHPLDTLSARLAELEAKEALLESKLSEYEGVRRLLGDGEEKVESKDVDEDADDRKLAFHILQEMKILRRMGRRKH